MPLSVALCLIISLILLPSTGPGQIALTVIPYSPSSAARDLVSPINAILDAEYAALNGTAFFPTIEAMFTILPPRLDFIIPGTISLQQRKAPVKFTLIV